MLNECRYKCSHHVALDKWYFRWCLRYLKLHERLLWIGNQFRWWEVDCLSPLVMVHSCLCKNSRVKIKSWMWLKWDFSHSASPQLWLSIEMLFNLLLLQLMVSFTEPGKMGTWIIICRSFNRQLGQVYGVRVPLLSELVLWFRIRPLSRIFISSVLAGVSGRILTRGMCNLTPGESQW